MMAENLVYGPSGISAALFQSLSKQDAAFHNSVGAGSISGRFAHDLTNLHSYFEGEIQRMFFNLASVISGCFYVFLASWQISLYAMTLVPMAALLSYYQARKLMVFGSDISDLTSNANTMVNDVFSHIMTVKSKKYNGVKLFINRIY